MRRFVENGQDAIAGLVFALLALAVVGHVWFASTPLPLGGPNIYLAVAAALLAAVLALAHRAAGAHGGLRETIAAAFRGPARLATLALLTALAMWTWVHVVYLHTGTFDAMGRAGQLTVGVGVLFALLCVLTARRARGLVAALAPCLQPSYFENRRV